MIIRLLEVVLWMVVISAVLSLIIASSAQNEEDEGRDRGNQGQGRIQENQ